MRQILIDYARRFSAEKHGGSLTQFPLEGVLIFSPEKSAALIALAWAFIGLVAPVFQ